MEDSKILEIIQTRIGQDKLTDFHFKEFITYPGSTGCIKINNLWFDYYGQDERGNIVIKGPFSDRGIICAIAIIFSNEKLYEEYEFSKEEEETFLHVYYNSIEEIKEKFSK